MQTSPPRALVAEDNPATAGVLKHSFQRAGFDVVWMANGSAAATKAESEPFDVIITDFQMPGACGEDVIRAARNGSCNEETPIFLCSAKGLELDTVAMVEAYRLEKVLFKPFSPLDIVELARSIASARAETCPSAAK